jgi:hypothetical protein
MKISYGIQKSIRRKELQTQRQHGDLISLFSFFENKENRLTTYSTHLTGVFCGRDCK